MNKRNNSPLVIHFLSDVFMRFDMKQQNWMCVTFALLFSIFTLGLGSLLCLKRLQRCSVRPRVFKYCLTPIIKKKHAVRNIQSLYFISHYRYSLPCSIPIDQATEDFCKLLLVAVAIGHFHFLHCFNLPVIKVVKS